MKKKIAFKFLSAIISLTLLIGVCAPAINVFASTESDEKTETTPWFSQETLDALNSYGFNVEDYVNKENLDQIKSEYSDEIADLGVAIENIVRISKTLGGIIAENYDLVYAGAYAELKANGTLDEIVAELQATNAQLNALADKLDSAEIESIYADAKANLVKELRLSAQTVDQITVIGH